MGNNILYLTNQCESRIEVKIEGTQADPQNFTLEIGERQRVQFVPSFSLRIVIGNQITTIIGADEATLIFDYTAKQINAECKAVGGRRQLANCISMRNKLISKD